MNLSPDIAQSAIVVKTAQHKIMTSLGIDGLLSSHPDAIIKIAGFTLSVEVANNVSSRELGLMHRRHLDPDCGMLFCYDEPRTLSFWMRNTHIPLSIAFIDDEGRIAGIEDLHPGDERPVSSSRPCRWALEASRGWFGERNIGVGSRVSGLSE